MDKERYNGKEWDPKMMGVVEDVFDGLKRRALTCRW